jgi:hypothetical protein
LLTEELVSKPKNYSIVSFLQTPEIMDGCSKKWKELGALKVEDIIKNSALPIDYHLRVSDNDLKSGFGQVDRNGKL